MNPFKENNHPALRTEKWGKVNGKQVYLYYLTNARGMSLVISNYGAAAVSCIVPDKNGVYEDVVLGYDSLSNYVNDKFYMGTVIGRYANRIENARVIIEGKEAKLTCSDGGYHHHGGKEGFNKKVFNPEVFEQESKKGIKLSYISVDGEEGFPGNLDLTVTYTLDDDNNWIVEYKATTDKPTILNLTQHSYFNLCGHASGIIRSHELQIMADEYLVVNHNYIPTGERKSVIDTVFDFTKPVKIGDHIDAPELLAGRGFDNTLVLEPLHTDTLKHAATAIDPYSGRTLKVYTTEPSLHFYTANFLEENTSGKNNAVYGRRSAFCLETQHFPDAPNHEDFPSTVLLPGEEFYSKTIFNFSISQ